jgi:hypothetical protein
MLPRLLLRLQHRLQLLHRLPHLLLPDHIPLRLLLLLLYLYLHLVHLLVQLPLPRPALVQLTLRLLIQLHILLLLLLRDVTVEHGPVLLQLGLIQQLDRVLVLLLKHLQQRGLHFLVHIRDRVLSAEWLRGELLLADPLLVDGRQVLIVV